MSNLSKKNFLVLGGTSGIGLDVTQKLSKLSKVCVIGRDKTNLEKLPKNNISFLKHDVKSLDGLVKDLSNNIDDSKFDGVFISVGIEQFKSLNLIKDKDLNTNFLPPILSLLAVLKLSSSGKLLNKNSSIVIMSSVSSVKGHTGMSIYGSSRAAIESIVKHASVELAGKSLRINAIRAGAFKTKMHERIINKMNKDQINDYKEKHPLGFGEIDDVSELVLYLLSKKSKWITGSILTIDGGYSAK